MVSVDLNADLGEERSDDNAMLKIVSSANLACGMHAGNLAIMTNTFKTASDLNVVIGAHPSYPDRENFGRVSMLKTMSFDQIEKTFDGQLCAFAGLMPYEDIPYIKPHGAMYNDAYHDDRLAEMIVGYALGFGAAVMHQPGSAVERVAVDWGVDFVAEVFADRAYMSNGTLVSRTTPGSVIEDPGMVADRVLQMVTEHLVNTLDGKVFEFEHVDSVCVHGDTPGAVEIADTVRTTLLDNSVLIEPFIK